MPGARRAFRSKVSSPISRRRCLLCLAASACTERGADATAASAPVEHAQSLGRALGISQLWVKRDDRSSPIFGGSKARKLEHLLADARERGHREVVTFGGAGSNHAVATAAFGRKLGLGVTVRLASQPDSADVRRKLRACMRLGAHVEAIGGVSDAFALAERRSRTGLPSEVPYVIAPGGSSRLGLFWASQPVLEEAAGDDVDCGALPSALARLCRD